MIHFAFAFMGLHRHHSNCSLRVVNSDCPCAEYVYSSTWNNSASPPQVGRLGLPSVEDVSAAGSMNKNQQVEFVESPKHVIMFVNELLRNALFRNCNHLILHSSSNMSFAVTDRLTQKLSRCRWLFPQLDWAPSVPRD